MANIEFLSVLAIAIGLSADCFAVAISGSIARRDYSGVAILRVSSSFGLFQALMPVLGWLAGKTVVSYVENYDHWLAFVLLAFVGGRMIWETFHSTEDEAEKTNITRGMPLLVLSIATSIDALAVGLSFAFLKVDMAVASLTIGTAAFLITVTGFVIGRKSSKLIGERAELFGAVILIGIGLKILLSHTL